MRHIIPSATLAMLLTACGNLQAPDVNPTPHDMKEGPGLFSGESGNILDGFKRGNNGLLGGGNGTGSMIATNVHLWRAALDVVSVLPLAQTDSAGGVIISEWASVPNTPSERLKLNVTLLGQSLTPDAVTVKVFKQKREKSMWVDAPQDVATARQLEDAILTKARVLSLQK